MPTPSQLLMPHWDLDEVQTEKALAIMHSFNNEYFYIFLLGACIQLNTFFDSGILGVLTDRKQYNRMTWTD